MMVVDIDFSEQRWAEFIEKYPNTEKLHFALRVENADPIPYLHGAEKQRGHAS